MFRDDGIGIFRRADGTPRERAIEARGRDVGECRCCAIDDHTGDGWKGDERSDEQGQDRGSSHVHDAFERGLS